MNVYNEMKFKKIISFTLDFTLLKFSSCLCKFKQNLKKNKNQLCF